MANDNGKTPKLDELEKGAWPSFVTEIKQEAKKNPMAKDLLGQLERSYEERIGHWKHGGIVGVMGYGGGVIGRYSDLPEDFPNVSHFHTLRINQPAGWFYNSEALRNLCDIWEKHGSGLTNMHGSTGDIIFLGTKTDELEPTFSDLTEVGFDLGGSGSDVRTPSCCCGMARCEWACYDTMKLTYFLTMHYQDELHRPAFPYKWKFKMSGCPNDCVASVARADMSIIGTWRDAIQMDHEEITNYAKAGMDIQNDVVENCPAKCMDWDGKRLAIDNKSCRKCMHCINAMPKALRPGKDRGATILIGSKAPIVEGALLSSVIVPFIKLEEPYDDLIKLVDSIHDVWAENGKNRERVGEFIQRVGMGNFLEEIGLEPIPEMVAHPRENPYVFYEDYYEEGEEEEEEK
ncbi:MAG: dissimilatory-type sulfite reductase subunit alpha [Ignavibacteria bacterium]|nr:dissimilatory-type sulfite reductase subunit alpha [Ignavibacteria bacterium]MBT8383310.1 dissimilatory-type sulfite reductase subunit alpha [Ignavibacteria bacterium]MBT8392994.1 dissimilatory-type sulfite reductase subunit alpha [Ignavibacteria bacterium]NNJ52096.1 dissimilatory-type sulfite reductase subunit alpha [Ignavibacteriaceae bacterium]NNL22617.1 dissimilatory-type sulfite reductase subunit alpha [Ignavibacteriaceae bacterium]